MGLAVASLACLLVWRRRATGHSQRGKVLLLFSAMHGERRSLHRLDSMSLRQLTGDWRAKFGVEQIPKMFPILWKCTVMGDDEKFRQAKVRESPCRFDDLGSAYPKMLQVLSP